MAEQELNKEAMVAYRNVVEFLQANEPDPDHPDLLYIAYGNIGLLYAKWEDLIQAQEYLEKALGASDPIVIAQTTFNLGRIAEKCGDKEKAKSLYEQAIVDGLEHTARAQVSLGRLLEKEGDIERAKALFQDALNSDDPEVVGMSAVGLGRIMEGEGRYRTAKKLYQQAMESGHERWTSLPTILLDMLLDKYELQATIDHLLDHFAQFTDREPELLFTLGESLIRESNATAAKIVLTRAADSRDQNVARRARDLLDELASE